jgi:hypothetical protein
MRWSAFADAGIRPVPEVRITAVQEPKSSPFANSLSFLQTADTGLLANWIVSQSYRRLNANCFVSDAARGADAEHDAGGAGTPSASPIASPCSALSVDGRFYLEQLVTCAARLEGRS